MPEGNNLLIYSFSLSFSCEKCHCNIPVVVEDNSMQTEQDPQIWLQLLGQQYSGQTE